MSTAQNPQPSESAAQIADQGAYLSNLYFAQEAIQNDFAPNAAKQTHDNAQAYQNALDTAKKDGTQPPTGYYQVSVDSALVIALYTGTDKDASHWNNIFLKTWYAPPPPAPPTTAAGYPVGPYTGKDNVYYDLSGGKYGPDGTSFGNVIRPRVSYSDARGTFTHHVVSTPFGNESWWTLNSGSN